jgi:hypothetical protein
MISDRFPLASIFLLVSGTLFLFVFALPILLVPLRWARIFRWNLPAETALTKYFARCLGGVAVAIVSLCFLAAGHPEQNLILFDLIVIVGAIMTAVHVWGALERTQPWTETAEIALYLGLAILAYAVRGTIA